MADNGIQFERPIGPCADTRELEYIAALHQTNVEAVRESGTIHSKDIRNYLTSRHGIYVEAPKLEERIIKEMCGTYVGEEDDDTTKPKFAKKKKEEEEPLMDLCQMMALLSIPYLRQEELAEAAKPSNSLVHGMVEQVLKLILEECERSQVNLSQFRAVDENFESGTKICTKLVQAMLDVYGEYHVPKEVLEEMVAMAKTPKKDDDRNDKSSRSNTQNSRSRHDSSHRSNHDDDDDSDNDNDEDSQPRLKTKPAHIARNLVDNEKVIMLNKDTFLRALTADVQLYNPEWEQQPTTHLQDVLTVPINEDRPSYDRIPMNSTFYTAPSIDQSADQYRSVSWKILIWFSFVIYFICYQFDEEGTVRFQDCEEAFGCQIGSSVVNWLVILVGLGQSGLIYIFFGSLGNSTALSGIGANKAMTGIGIAIGIGVVVSSTIVPAFLSGEAFVWNINPMTGWEPLYWFCFALGILIVCVQLIRFVDNCADLGTLGVGGRTRMEQCTKMAATKRVNIMMDNAMLLHVAPALPGEKVKSGSGWKFPAKHASPIVVKLARDLHDGKDKIKGLSYREGSNVEALTDGEGHERALKHYYEIEHVTETTGGILWAYERMADGRLYDEEGVWLSARLLAANCIQWFVAIMVVGFYFSALEWFRENKEKTVGIGQRRLLEDEFQQQQGALKQYVASFERRLREKQQRDYHLQRHRQQQHLSLRRLQFIEPVNSTHYRVTGQRGVYPNLIYDINSTHFTDGSSIWKYSLNSHNGTHVFDKYFPFNSTGFSDGKQFYPYSEYATNGTHMTNGEYLFDGVRITSIPGNPSVQNAEDWEFKFGASAAMMAAFLATVGIAVVYIPSFVSTVIKFRSGLFPTLKAGPKFQQLRENPHRATTLLGSALWGSMYTACWSALFVGGTAFLAAWSETRTTATSSVAFFFGVFTIWLIKFVFVRIFRELYISSFYRRHPAVINFLNVVLECCSLAIAVGTMMVRSIKLLIIAMIHIGRIDVPTFGPGIGYIGPYSLDSDHFCFKNDLLIHEAHRHPLIERLGMMYLMKLHHGSDFGTRAGAYWRMLFVLALMPWMRDYRVRHFGDKKPKRGGDDDDDEDDPDDEEKARKQGGDDSSVMSLHGMDLEIDIVKRANESLAQRNADLKQAVADIKAKLRDEKKNVLRLERRLAREKAKRADMLKAAKEKKKGPVGVAEAKKPAKANTQDEKPSAATQNVVTVDDDDDDEESFESESETKTGTGIGKDSSGDFEDDFQSDSEEETFSQAVAREREKLVEQKKRSDARAAAETEVKDDQHSASEVKDDEQSESEFKDDEHSESEVKDDEHSDSEGKDDEQSASPEALHGESEESQIETSGEDFGKSMESGTSSNEFGSSEEFEDEYVEDNKGEESLADVLKKAAGRTAQRRTSGRDPE